MPRDTFSVLPDDLSDDGLLLLYGQGDKEAARMLAARLGPRAFAYAYRLLGDRAEAEDIAQEAMLRLWKMAPDWQVGQAKVTTWLFRVVGNLAMDLLRARRRRRAVPLDDAPEVADGAASALGGMIDDDRMAALQSALDRLPERQRQAVVLRHIEGMTNPEIAAIMEVGVEAVESLTARGKRALAAALAGRREELGYDEGDRA